MSSLRSSRAGSSPLVALGEIEFCNPPPPPRPTLYKQKCFYGYCTYQYKIKRLKFLVVIAPSQIIEDEQLFLAFLFTFKIDTALKCDSPGLPDGKFVDGIIKYYFT